MTAQVYQPMDAQQGLRLICKLALENKIDYSHYTLARFIHHCHASCHAFDLWLCVLVNAEISRGNVCVNLAQIEYKSAQLGWTDCPPASSLAQAVADSVLTGEPEQQSLLIVEYDKLYFNRMRHNEILIAERLRQIASIQNGAEPLAPPMVDRLFHSVDDVDYQKLAALIACRHRLSIISGGPGTGKTWTVSRLLALLLQLHPQLRISLAAPTGKAAARLSTSIQALTGQLELSDELFQRFPQQVSTLHRLLGIHRFSHRPRYDAGNPLTLDLLVIDEASMIDQQMMAMICAALPAQARLILLGDRDQLSSVEAGSVLADLCADADSSAYSARQCEWLAAFGYKMPAASNRHALSDHVVVLHKSHRFGQHSAIGRLARCVNLGDVDGSIELLRSDWPGAELVWRDDRQEFARHLQARVAEYFKPMTTADSVLQAFSLFHRFRILSPLWEGPAGVDRINEMIEQSLYPRQSATTEALYPGKPLMMNANLYQYEIYNGDIGILWPDDKGRLRVWFEQGDLPPRSLSLSQLPVYRTAYAMTVHKSQGSEFNRVLLVLPAHDSPVCTRELFYTAITRATEQVELWSNEQPVRQAIERRTERTSGLLQRLQNGEPRHVS